MALTWFEVLARLKFYGPEDGGLDGEPDEVNGVPADGYGGAFSLADKNNILSALRFIFEKEIKMSLVFTSFENFRTILGGSDNTKQFSLAGLCGSI